MRDGALCPDTRRAPELGSEIPEAAVGWKSLDETGACLRRRAWFAGVVGAIRLCFQMSENTIDDSGIGDERDDLHGGATGAKKRVGLEYFLDKARPGCPALLSELRDPIG